MHHVVPNTINRGRSLLSTIVLGGTAITITILLSASVVALYCLNIVDRKSESLFGMAHMSIASLPELADALPPALGDLLNDQRRPDYLANVDVSVDLVPAESRGRKLIRPVIEVRNEGSEMISLLSMRISVMNAEGFPVAEWNEWAATPIAADDDWRGPLMPGGVRRFVAHGVRVGDFVNGDHTAAFEITDLRVWDSSPKTVATTAARSE